MEILKLIETQHDTLMGKHYDVMLCLEVKEQSFFTRELAVRK